MSDADRLKLLVPDAKQTTRVSGKVLVDGKPVKDLFVYLNPAESKGAPGTAASKAQCNADGQFDVGTYVGSDGAPKGTYKVTMQWLKHNDFGNRWSGPDQLKGLYSDPAKSEFTIDVKDAAITNLSYELALAGKGGNVELKSTKKVDPKAGKR